MGSARFRMSSAGARSLLTSPGAVALVRAEAERCAAACNAQASADSMRNRPFESDASSGGTRARASVFTATPHGSRHNAKHDTIMRSL